MNTILTTKLSKFLLNLVETQMKMYNPFNKHFLEDLIINYEFESTKIRFIQSDPSPPRL